MAHWRLLSVALCLVFFSACLTPNGGAGHVNKAVENGGDNARPSDGSIVVPTYAQSYIDGGRVSVQVDSGNNENSVQVSVAGSEKAVVNASGDPVGDQDVTVIQLPLSHLTSVGQTDKCISIAANFKLQGQTRSASDGSFERMTFKGNNNPIVVITGKLPDNSTIKLCHQGAALTYFIELLVWLKPTVRSAIITPPKSAPHSRVWAENETVATASASFSQDQPIDIRYIDLNYIPPTDKSGCVIPSTYFRTRVHSDAATGSIAPENLPITANPPKLPILVSVSQGKDGQDNAVLCSDGKRTSFIPNFVTRMAPTWSADLKNNDKEVWVHSPPNTVGTIDPNDSTPGFAGAYSLAWVADADLAAATSLDGGCIRVPAIPPWSTGGVQGKSYTADADGGVKRPIKLLKTVDKKNMTPTTGYKLVAALGHFPNGVGAALAVPDSIALCRANNVSTFAIIEPQ